MPNWVNVSMVVSGEAKELKRFREFAKSNKNKIGEKSEINVLASENFIPYPEKYAKYDREPKAKKRIEKNDGKRKRTFDFTDGYNMGGYDWCLKNWGSKWGICNAYLQNDLDKKAGQTAIVYTFESPWSFPEQLLLKMSKMFPKLEFSCEMDEESFDFIGERKYKAGKIIEDDVHNPTTKELVDKEYITKEEAEEYYGKNWEETK